MKRQLDLHGNVVASFCPTTMDALTVARRGAHREARCQMDTIGLDLHKRESQLCIGQIFSNAVSQRVDVLSPNGTRDFGGRSFSRTSRLSRSPQRRSTPSPIEDGCK